MKTLTTYKSYYTTLGIVLKLIKFIGLSDYNLLYSSEKNKIITTPQLFLSMSQSKMLI